MGLIFAGIGVAAMILTGLIVWILFVGDPGE